MGNDLLLDAIAAAWLFGALIFWPLARAIDATPRTSLRMLKWTFVMQVALQVLWGAWVAILWFREVSQIQHGLIPLYLMGTVGWVVGLVGFVYWMLERRKPRAESATHAR